MVKFFKDVYKKFDLACDRVDKFFAEQEKKKVLCGDCCFIKFNMRDFKCLHPDRAEEEKSYITGKITRRYKCCDCYNSNGQCKKFEPKEEA